MAFSIYSTSKSSRFSNATSSLNSKKLSELVETVNINSNELSELVETINTNSNELSDLKNTINETPDTNLTIGTGPSNAFRADLGVSAYLHSLSLGSNPHQVNKANIGLSNVDNTSDMDKPVSTLIQQHLDSKQDLFDVNNKINLDLIGDGNLTNTEFGYLSNVIAPIQTQLDSKISNMMKADLYTRGYDIIGKQDVNMRILPTGSGQLVVKGNGINSGINLSDGLITIRSGTNNSSKLELFCDIQRHNKVTIQAPTSANLTNDVAIILPSSEGTYGQLFSAETNGQTKWISPSKDTVGLNNVDNTSDANKPTSLATQTLIDNLQTQITDLLARVATLESP